MKLATWLVMAGIGFSAALVADEESVTELPRDGAWVRYKVLIKHDTGREFDFKITTKFLGQEDIDGRRCRWIEIEWDKLVYKFLVPEKSLRDDDRPLNHSIKAIFQDANGEVSDLTEDRTKSMSFVLYFLPAARKTAKRLAEPKLVKYQARQLMIQESFQIKDSKTSLIDAVKYVDERECQVWVHQDIPIGYAHLVYKGKNKIGESNLSWTQEHSLESFGYDAKSAFSE